MRTTIRQRLIMLMSYLKWNGIDDWSSLDPRIQETHIPLVQTWVLQHIQYLPDFPEKGGLTPRRSVEEYYTKDKIEHGWERQMTKTMGLVALAAMINLERKLGITER